MTNPRAAEKFREAQNPREAEWLFGPGLHFDPTYPALVYHATGAAAADALDQEAFRELQEMPLTDKMTPRSTFGRLPLADRLFISHFEHERDHLLRSTGTTFGLLLFAVRRFTVEAARQLLRLSTEPPPFHRAAEVRAYTMEHSQSPGFLRERTMPEGRRAQLLFGFADLLLRALSFDAPALSLWPALELFQPALGEEAVFSLYHSFPDYLKSNTEAAPHLHVFRGRPIRTQDLFEYCAVRHQLNMASLTGVGAPEAFETLEELVAGERPEWSEYRFVETAWATLCPDAFFAKEVIREPGTAPLRGIWRAYPVELLAAIDLAFWVPFGPAGALTEHPLSWLDLSPGWRFARVLAHLHETKPTMNLMPKTGGADVFLGLQENWCRQFGWTTPEALCRAWLPALERAETPSIDRLSDARRRLALEAICHRQRDPIAAATSIDYQGKPAEFPLVIRPSGQGWDRFGTEHEISHWMLSESLLKLARHRSSPYFSSPSEVRTVADVLTEGLPGTRIESLLEYLH